MKPSYRPVLRPNLCEASEKGWDPVKNISQNAAAPPAASHEIVVTFESERTAVLPIVASVALKSAPPPIAI
jgi:hypothetical protein